MADFIDIRTAAPKLQEAGALFEGPHGCIWRTDAFKTEQYRASFVEVPIILNDWLQPYGGISGRNILDFGCGEAISGLGLALLHPDAQIYAVDVIPRVGDCLAWAQREIQLNKLPPNLHLRQIDVGEVPFPGIKFDFVFSWSVFEHIDQRYLESVTEQLVASVADDGLIFVQIDPLFYSAGGSHLLPWIPERWAHLKDQDDIYLQKLRDALDNDEAAFVHMHHMYATLNRLTHPQLASVLQQAGLEIVREYYAKDEGPIPEPLAHIYSEDILQTHGVVYMCRRRRP